MTSSKTTPPTIIIRSEENAASDAVIGRNMNLADSVLNVYVQQLRLIHMMMVELPLAWVRDSAPQATAIEAQVQAVIVQQAISGQEAIIQEAIIQEAIVKETIAVPPPAMAANLDTADLLPATRKHKKTAAGEAKSDAAQSDAPKLRKAGAKSPAPKPPAKKSTRKGPPPAPLH